jgi:hypothetical protein
MEIDMTNLTEATAHALELLRVNSESTCTEADGTVWGMVYLDNAVPHGWSKHQFAGHLSDLKSNGLYRPTYDDAFGEVKLDR